MTIENTDKQNQTKVILVGLSKDRAAEAFARSMDELALLAKTCEMDVLAEMTQNADTPVQSTYIGSGKVDELKAAIAETGADLALFDDTLSPMQYRNLGRELKCEVMDRTGLILRIFSDHARTREARLQVEHAQLQYILPRLAGMWTHFGRQGGGAGLANRGVGETQIELDRRHIERRMAELSRELKKIDEERKTQRARRMDAELPKVALVGYTNAGKSTILNAMLALDTAASEGREVLAENKLFATLDTTVRRIAPENELPFLLSDTVGFISELPHSLVKSFRSTLEEVQYADLLVQVVDYSDPDYRECMKTTEETLRGIGAGAVPMITVFNKADVPAERGALVFTLPHRVHRSIYMSAKTGEGMRDLLSLIEEVLQESFAECSFLFPYEKSAFPAALHKSAMILGTEYREDGILLRTRCSRADRMRYAPYLVP